MRYAVVFGVAAAVAVAAPITEASPSARLVYVRGAGAEACPDEATLRAAVKQRLGYDPFFPTARKTVVAQLTRTSKGYRARVQLAGEDGNARGERDLSTSGDDCGELTSAIALAISLALDDLDDLAPDPTPSDPAQSSPEPAPSSSPELALPSELASPSELALLEPAPIAAASRAELAASLGPSVSLGTAPGAAAGMGLGLALRWPRIAARVDVRGELPSSADIGAGGRVRTNIASATGSLCVRFAIPFACAGAGVGAVWSSTEGIAGPANDHASFFVASSRFGADVALGARFYVEPFVDVGANLTRPRVEVDGRSVYEMSPIWGALGVHVGTTIF